MAYKPRYCKTCIERGEKPKLAKPPLAWCREHYNEYQRERRKRLKEEHDEFLKTHNEYGEEINEWGMTKEETEAYVQAELERLDEQYGEG